MKHPSATQLLAELQKPNSPEAQLAALRKVKNEIVGHPQKKELWIQHGILDALSRILSAYHRSSAFDPARGSNSTQATEHGHGQRIREDIVLQAIIVVGSIAQGGAHFVDPLAAAQIIPILASILNPSSSSPQIILGVLRALNTFADSSLLQQWKGSANGAWQLRQLFSPQNVTHLVRIMEQEPAALIVQQQITLTAVLISKTCTHETYRKQLSASGMVEALAHQLTQFMSDYGFDAAADSPFYSTTPRASRSKTSRTRLWPMMQAIATVIRNEKRRAERFLHALAVHEQQFFKYPQEWQMDHARANGFGVMPQGSRSSPSSSTLPPLGGLAVWGKARPGAAFDSSSGFAESESPLASWLAYIVHREQSLTKLMAAWLLAILFKYHLVTKDCFRSISMQLIPVIARMLDSDTTVAAENAPAFDDGVIQPPQWLIKRLAPHVLGLLVSDSKQLQLSASEAGVVKKLAQLLRQTFDTLPNEEEKPFWNAHPTSQPQSTHEFNSTSLGPPGLTPWACQVLQMRESVLEALASMATQEDDLRKTIIAHGVVQHIVASLHPDPSRLPKGMVEDQPGKIHNPTPVLMQACAAATALSRSVSTLRTSLIDAGLAKPIFTLLRYPDLDVRIAATGATCNIVLEFSPMRQEMIDDGVLKVLCKQAHTTHMHLRLNCLWALKHLAHAAPNTLKMSCVENLGSSWLKQIICNDADSPSHPPPLALGTPNAAGERVDLLNSDDLGHGLPDADDDGEVRMTDDHAALELFDGADDGLTNPKNLDQEDAAEQARRARVESAAVQEQALDLIRNLISGPGSVEMVDYIFQEFGQQMLFDLLTNLLRTRSADSGPGRGGARHQHSSSGGSPLALTPTGARHTAPPSSQLPSSQLAAAVIHVLVHLAGGGLPRHRALLLTQTELMRLVVQLAPHPNPEVRRAYAWLGINLSWLDDAADRDSARARVRELRRLGMVDRLDALQQDANLDVRERAKTALVQIHEAEGGLAA